MKVMKVHSSEKNRHGLDVLADLFQLIRKPAGGCSKPVEEVMQESGLVDLQA